MEKKVNFSSGLQFIFDWKYFCYKLGWKIRFFVLALFISTFRSSSLKIFSFFPIPLSNSTALTPHFLNMRCQIRKRCCFLQYAELNGSPPRGCNFWCAEAHIFGIINVQSILVPKMKQGYFEHWWFQKSLYQKWNLKIMVLWNVFLTIPISLLNLKHWLRNGKQNEH